MKTINRAIDRFCYRHPNFGIPNLMLYIIIGNVIVFLFSMMDTTGLFLQYLLFSPDKILSGQVWRLITFVFIPPSRNLLYLALFLYFYYFIGSTLERQWGAGRFTMYYFSGILLTVIYGFVVGLLTNSLSMISLSADYINLSLFFAYATLFPDNRVLLFFIIPIKIKWLALLNAAFFILQIIITPFPLSLLPIMAVLNYLVYCGDTLLSYVGVYKNRFSPRRINFKMAVKNSKAGSSGKAYTRKCAVCGKTDTDYPNLEFRFCSRCEGYHCFCIDHINSHVHFKE